MTHKIFLRIAVSVASLAILLAAAAFSATDIIPCVPGNKWEYDSVKLVRGSIENHGKTLAEMNDASSGSAVYQVVSADTKSDPPAYNYKETTNLSSVTGNSETENVEIKLASDKTGLKILSSFEDDGGKKPDKQTYNPPLLYFDKTVTPGKAWNVGVLRQGDSKNPTTAQGVARETVSVPAGSFKDCLKVVYTTEGITGTFEMWGKTMTITSGHSRGVYWIADGVGVVKELEVTTSTAQTTAPDGSAVTVDFASCEVNELKPGYTVNLEAPAAKLTAQN